jgi:hypothetical protein
MLSMINSKPNNKNYHQGNFIPTNTNKVLKLNNQGGVFYRSSWEKRVMVWLDNNPQIVKWGAESISIPYQLTHFESNGDMKLKSHTYYADFYYQIRMGDGSIRDVIAEVKPQKEFNMVTMIQEKRFKIPDGITMKKLKNLEYDFKMAQKNLKKWETMIKFCDKKGWEFIVITEDVLKKMGVL